MEMAESTALWGDNVAVRIGYTVTISSAIVNLILHRGSFEINTVRHVEYNRHVHYLLRDEDV